MHVSFNSQWPHFLVGACAAVSFAAGLVRFLLFDWFDPLHCNDLLSDGAWLDKSFQNWQPKGCMMKKYMPDDVEACFSSRRIVFVGDSTVRKVYFQFANLLDSSLPSAPPPDTEKHSDYTLHDSFGNDISFKWDPYLNTSANSDLALPHHNASDRPALSVWGGGLWYLRYDYSGGLPAWEANVELLLNGLAKKASADTVVILPVEEVEPSKLSPERRKTIRLSDIDAMNSDLHHRIHPDGEGHSEHISRYSSKSVPISLPVVFNKMLDGSQTNDGLHFSDTIIRNQATLLLNLRCNDNLVKKYPFDHTCCSSYPWPVPLQALLLMLVSLFGPVQWFLARRSKQRVLSPPYVTTEEWPALSISAVASLTFIADRTGFWLKEQKQFDALTFAVLVSIALLAGLGSIRNADKDLGFLNREQTDEWKGWMQLAILIYHFCGASKVSGIYNPIRVLVASYLFMTGYGHTTYYMRKAEFHITRVVQVMFRLNFLTLLLAYTMNTDYLFYYFAPLVSLWYISITATMALGSRYNDHMVYLAGKIILSSLVFAWFVKADWPLNQLFSLLERFCGIHWSARESRFRIELDQWITYVGMFAAIAVQKLHNHSVLDHPKWYLTVKATTVISAVTMLWYLVFELSQPDKFAYNAFHPYVSFLPILAFVQLRNASPYLRSRNSAVFAFVGRISLELFIIQYHFWLAADTKGLLQVWPGVKWRPVTFILITTVFIYLSWCVAEATSTIADWFCGSKPSLPITSTANQSNGASTLEEERIPLNAHTSRSDDTTEAKPNRFVTHRISLLLYGRSQGNWHIGVFGKTTALFAIMWIINISWPYPVS